MIAKEEVSIENSKIVLHETTDTRSEVLATLQAGQKIFIRQEKNGWCFVQVNPKVGGWIPKWVLDNPNITNESQVRALSKEETPVFQRPEAKASSLGNIGADELLDISYEADGWVQINYKGQYGYLPTSQLNFMTEAEYQKHMAQIKEEEDKQKAKEAAEKTVYAMKSGEAIFDNPSLRANVLANTNYEQKFELIDVVHNGQENVEFFHVKDDLGHTAYIESRIAAHAVNFINHRQGPTVHSLEEAVIVIDPGHGGTDSGTAYEPEQVYEKYHALDTSIAIKNALEAAGAKVIMTRTEDIDLDLNERVEISHQQQADLFISVHFDHEADPDWSGTTTYFYHPSDRELAEIVNQSMTQLPLRNNGAIFGDYQVLRKNQTPALLLELGYVSNKEDRKKITDPNYYQEVAEKMVQSLKQYFK